MRMARDKLEDKIRRALHISNKNIVGTPGGILHSLFIAILKDVLPEKYNFATAWNFLMNKYVTNPINKVEKDHRSISSTRSNLTKELFNTAMSWKVFCKGLRVLSVVKFKIMIQVTKDNGKNAWYEANVDLSSPDDEDVVIESTTSDESTTSYE